MKTKYAKASTAKELHDDLAINYEGVSLETCKKAVRARVDCLSVYDETSGVRKEHQKPEIAGCHAFERVFRVKEEKETRKVSKVQKALNKVNDLGKDIPKLNQKGKEKVMEAITELLTTLNEEC